MGGGCRKSCPSLVAGNPNLFAGKTLVAIATQKRGEYVGFFVFLVNLVDFKRFSLTYKGFNISAAFERKILNIEEATAILKRILYNLSRIRHVSPVKTNACRTRKAEWGKRIYR